MSKPDALVAANPLSKFEPRVLKLVRKAVAAMLKAAAAAISGTPNPDTIRAAAARAWTAELPTLGQGLTKVVTDAAAEAVPQIGRLGGVDQYAADYIREATNRLKDVPDAVFERITTQLADGFKAGDTPQELRARVAAELKIGQWDARASVIARTECLPADAVVNAANITAVYRRWHSGDWVEIVTASGRKFAGTPNHPVLTLGGWRGLGELTEGNALVCHSAEVEGSGAAGDKDVEHPPSTIGEIFDSFSTVFVPERERTGKPDFHGDGSDGYVDVLRTYGVLRLGRFVPVEQGCQQLILEGTDMRDVLLAATRAPFPRCVPVPGAGCLSNAAHVNTSLSQHALYRPVRDPELGSDLLDAAPRAVLADDPLDGQAVQQPGMLAAGELCQGGVALASLHARVSDDPQYGAGVASDYLADGFAPQPGTVELDYVLTIRFGRWQGHVYNLTTSDGYFVSNELYTGNTTGAYGAGADAAARVVAEQLGIPARRTWISSHDGRTRPGHRAADQQTVGPGEAFTVGGEKLRFPGDPLGSPENTISCRCTIALALPGGLDRAEIERRRQAMTARVASAIVDDLERIQAGRELVAKLGAQAEWLLAVGDAERTVTAARANAAVRDVDRYVTGRR